MIEKLKTLEDDEIDMSVGAVNTRFADTELVRKINELVDAVNILQAQVAILQEHAHPTATTEPAENVLTKSLRMDKEFAEDECVRLQNELERTRKALETLQEFITKLYLNGNITDEQLERYKKTLITALEQKDK